MCTVADTPNIAQQNINAMYRLRSGHFVIMCTELQRFYIGEVLDIYKKGTSSRYGSVDDASTAAGLSYLALRVYLPLKMSLVCGQLVLRLVEYSNGYSCFRMTAIRTTNQKMRRLLFFQVDTAILNCIPMHPSRIFSIIWARSPLLVITVPT